MVQVLDGPQGSNTISIMESSEASDNDEKQFLMPNIIPDRKGLFYLHFFCTTSTSNL